MLSIHARLAQELVAKETQVAAAVELLDAGATVPFIARYRKEVTGGLDDTQLRLLEERLRYLRELEERREVVLNSIEEQGKLTPELAAEIREADSKVRLEDLYRPYMKKRRTKAQIAREAGLEPLALGLLRDPTLSPEDSAQDYVDADKGVADVAAALDGARQILMENFAEDAELVGRLREFAWEAGKLMSKVVTGKEQEGAKFSDYFDAAETMNAIPSHRALALFRGRTEGVLQLSLVLDEVDENGKPLAERSRGEVMIARLFNIEDHGRPADRWLLDTARWAWRVKLSLHLETDLNLRLREQAEEEAIKDFARNLHDLLLAAPAGPRATMGLDPGLRTGVKVAVVDTTGKVVATATIYPHVPKNQWDEAIHMLAALAAKHNVDLISIGNGTASRETDKLAKEQIKRHPELNLTAVMVSEAGASVYSASELAAQEFPELDVSLRGAVSIARRLQDPHTKQKKNKPKTNKNKQKQHNKNQTQNTHNQKTKKKETNKTNGVDVN